MELTSNESLSHVVLYLWIEQNWLWGIVSGVLSKDDDDDDDNNENDDDDDEYSNFTVCNKNNEALILPGSFSKANVPQLIPNTCHILGNWTWSYNWTE